MEIQMFEFLKHVFQLRRKVDLDHNATTPVSSRVRRKMNDVLKGVPGNPSSFHGSGRQAAELLHEARQQVAVAIGADPQEVVFTSGATEANNAVLRSVSAHFGPNKQKIVSTPLEHPSVMNVLAHLETQGVVVEYCPVDRHGRVRLAELARRVDDETGLVCCMFANNETGVIQDLAAVVNIARRHGAFVLADCVQALGKIPVDVHALGVDYASFSAHKLYGPKGIGALYVKRGSPFAPLLLGGHQESGLRAGTECLHNIVGFGAACEDVGQLLAQADQTLALKRQLLRRLKQIKPDGVMNSPDNESECLPNTLSLRFPGVDNAGLMGRLDHRGVAVSAGSACATGEATPSHVLRALGLSDQAARETLRISLGRTTSARDIQYTAQVIQEYIEGRTALVNMLTPAQLNETVLFDDNTYLLDVRPSNDREQQPGLPNAHEVNPLWVGRYLGQLPRDKQIVVYCPGGGLSLMVAYYLKAKGFQKVTNLRGGLHGWRQRRPDLYQRYAGQNVTVLQPDRPEAAVRA